MTEPETPLIALTCAVALILSAYYGIPWTIPTTAITAATTLVVFMRFEKHHANSKTIALLGVLTAVTVTSRQIIHGVEASPIFFMITIAGYTFGHVSGFIVGSTTMLVSNFFVGGHGPWTPYQMVAAGAVGFFAATLPKTGNKKINIVILSIYCAASAYPYGGITNIFWWITFTPHESIGSYFALAGAALMHDTARAVGNLFFMVFLGPPVFGVLERFQRRFQVKYVEAV